MSGAALWQNVAKLAIILYRWQSQSVSLPLGTIVTAINTSIHGYRGKKIVMTLFHFLTFLEAMSRLTFVVLCEMSQQQLDLLP